MLVKCPVGICPTMYHYRFQWYICSWSWRDCRTPYTRHCCRSRPGNITHSQDQNGSHERYNNTQVLGLMKSFFFYFFLVFSFFFFFSRILSLWVVGLRMSDHRKNKSDLGRFFLLFIILWPFCDWLDIRV